MGVKRPLSGSVVPMRISLGASAALPILMPLRHRIPTINARLHASSLPRAVLVRRMSPLLSPRIDRLAELRHGVPQPQTGLEVLHCVQEGITSQQACTATLLECLISPTPQKR